MCKYCENTYINPNLDPRDFDNEEDMTSNLPFAQDSSLNGYWNWSIAIGPHNSIHLAYCCGDDCYDLDEFEGKINYCPMCGRKL